MRSPGIILKIGVAKEFGRAPGLIIGKHYSVEAERIRGHLAPANVERNITLGLFNGKIMQPFVTGLLS